jgi:hypothetical protein
MGRNRNHYQHAGETMRQHVVAGITGILILAIGIGGMITSFFMAIPQDVQYAIASTLVGLEVVTAYYEKHP